MLRGEFGLGSVGLAWRGKAVKAGFGTDCQVKVRRVVAVWVWMVGSTFGWVALGMAWQEWLGL